MRGGVKAVVLTPPLSSHSLRRQTVIPESGFMQFQSKASIRSSGRQAWGCGSNPASHAKVPHKSLRTISLAQPVHAQRAVTLRQALSVLDCRATEGGHRRATAIRAVCRDKSAGRRTARGHSAHNLGHTHQRASSTTTAS